MSSTEYEKILDLLFANGADINRKYYTNGETLLHRAIAITDPSRFYMQYFKGLSKYLICKGADVNARNNRGYEPFQTLKYLLWKVIMIVC